MFYTIHTMRRLTATGSEQEPMSTLAKPLGDAAEIVPQSNTARLTVGATLRVLCLVDRAIRPVVT